MVTNATGTIVKESDYYPYGGEIPIITGDSNRYKFSGKERDTESGLDNFGARYDSSSLGRFMTPDWAARPTAVPYAVFGDPQSLNLYGYVRNDPVSRADLDGHAAEHDAFINMGDSSMFGYSMFAMGAVTISELSSLSNTQVAQLRNQLILLAQARQAQQNQMSLSPKGLNFIKQHEGYRDKVYKDVAGNPTIGYGHLIKEGENFEKGVTEQKASELLSQDTKTAVSAVNAKVTAKLSQTAFDALVDFAYNLGGKNFGKSTLLSNLNSGKDVTKENFTDWNHAGGKVVGGLTVRRTDEFNLFSKGDYGGP
jgi:RHS repeat-associated protein